MPFGKRKTREEGLSIEGKETGNRRLCCERLCRGRGYVVGVSGWVRARMKDVIFRPVLYNICIVILLSRSALCFVVLVIIPRNGSFCFMRFFVGRGMPYFRRERGIKTVEDY